MKRFQFELQAVLDDRKRVEDESQQSYAAARHAHANARSILGELEMLKVEMLDNLHRLRLTDSIDPSEQMAYERYMTGVARDIQMQEQILDEMADSVERCRLLLVDATQSKEVVLTLHDESLRAHVSEAERTAQNEVDELATVRHQYRAGQAKAA